MATIRSKAYHRPYHLDVKIEKAIIEYLESLPIGSICVSAELKQLVFGEVPKERMIMFERACKALMLSHGFEYIGKPWTNEYKQQRCYQKVKADERDGLVRDA